MERGRKELLSLLHHVSGELSSENLRGLCFLFGVSNTDGHCCCCCSKKNAGPLDVLENLLDRGYYTQFDLSRLVEVLDEVGRTDLANECKKFTPPEQMTGKWEMRAPISTSLSKTLSKLATGMYMLATCMYMSARH